MKLIKKLTLAFLQTLSLIGSVGLITIYLIEGNWIMSVLFMGISIVIFACLIDDFKGGNI